MNWDNFRSALEHGHEWPCQYCFKFITKVESLDQVLAHFGHETTIRKNYSRTGRYVSVTAIRESEDADAVIAVYKRVSDVEGVIPL